MIETIQNSQVGVSNAKTDEQKKQEANNKRHQKLSTIFVIVGIISFSLGAVVNFYTIKRFRGGKA